MTDKMPKPDDVVAGYRIVRVIGKGGMGAVFEAVDDKNGQRAAIKVLHAHLSQDQETTARFLNEAKAIATLDHPGIVRLLSSGSLDEGGCYIAMEFIDGETLSAKLKREKRLGREGLRLGSQIASALQAAHRRNIVHRDLKPSNILLPSSVSDGESAIRIIDFGIAKMAAEDREVQDFHTRTGTMIGTPVYMAPEQCRGVAVNDRTDVYALGIILYQMLTGRPPFYSQADGDILAMHILVPPRPLREMEPAVPEKVASFVEKMLAKEGSDRPSMSEVEQELRVLTDDPSWSSPGSAPASEATSVSTTPISPETPESMPTLASRTLAAPTLGGAMGQAAASTRHSPIRRGLALSLAVLVVLGSLAVALLLRKTPTATPVVVSQPAVVVTPLHKTVRWMLRTNPDGAEIFDESGKSLGLTPWTREQPSGTGSQTVFVRKAGFSELRLSFANDRDVERSEVLAASQPPVSPPPVAVTRPQPKRIAPSKGRKNDSLILDFKTHKKLN